MLGAGEAAGSTYAIVLFLLFMMVAMLVGPAYLYLTTLNFTIGDVAIWEIAVFMSVGMMPIGVLLFAKFWMQGDPDRKAPLPLSSLLEHVSEPEDVLHHASSLASEFLMGWTFNLASGLIALSAGLHAVPGRAGDQLQPHHILVRLHDGRGDGDSHSLPSAR